MKNLIVSKFYSNELSLYAVTYMKFLRKKFPVKIYNPYTHEIPYSFKINELKQFSPTEIYFFDINYC